MNTDHRSTPHGAEFIGDGFVWSDDSAPEPTLTRDLVAVAVATLVFVAVVALTLAGARESAAPVEARTAQGGGK